MYKTSYNSIYSKNKKVPKYNFLKIIVPVFLFIVLQGYYYNYLISPNQNYIEFTIEKNENLTSISNRLKDLNLIQSTFLFKRNLSNKNLDSKIKSGTFTIPTQININDLASIITSNSTINQNKIQIIEGEKIAQIESKYAKLRINDCIWGCGFEEFTKTYNLENSNISTLEGFIYPDTYYVNSENMNQNLVEKALENFQIKTSKIDLNQINNLPVENFYEVLIVASLVEREVFQEIEKPIVAGIIYKRLENDWTLGIDAALLYEKNENTITSKDLSANSEYNLRKFKGLPPTPIANPSIESIEAALYPKKLHTGFT